MRVILWVVLALGIAWAGYWFVGSNAVENAAQNWFDHAADQGIDATQQGISVAGFPNRFDLTVTQPHLMNPATGVGWDAPFAQVFAMTWKPWHVIAALPNTQTVTLPDQKVTVQSSKMQASVRLVPTSDLTFAEAVVEGHDLEAKSDLGWQVAAKSVVAAMAGQGNDQHLGLDVTDLALDPAMAPTLGGVVSMLHLDAVVSLTAPLDRRLAEVQPQVTAINVSDFHAVWGEMTVTASGKITPGTDGLATGRVDFHFKNWRGIPQLLVTMGVVQPGLAKSITGGLDALAKSGPDPETLDMALIFADGRMNFGPLPLGPAPRLN
ncbi:MAG: DUF2125 domain-containing protein [Pseudorhodobacter sp.]|nr:DUF2125 domain-containing protein [Pseudorhodobacter sp.]